MFINDLYSYPHHALRHDRDEGYSFQDYVETVIAAAAKEPIEYEDISDQLRLDQTDDRALVVKYGVASRQTFEHLTNLVCVATTFRADYSHWPHHYGRQVIRIPRRPVSSIVSITYIDESGSSQTLPTTSYAVDIRPAFARIILFGEMPELQKHNRQAVRVTYVAGVAADQASVPADISVAIAQHAATSYQNREHASDGKFATLPSGFDAVLRKYSAPKV